jgi:hypothetical protein
VETTFAERMTLAEGGTRVDSQVPQLHANLAEIVALLSEHFDTRR